MTKEILFKAVENLIAAHPNDTVIKRLGANFKVEMLFAGKTNEVVIERRKPFEKITNLSPEEVETVKELLKGTHISITEERKKGKTLVYVTKVEGKKVYFGEMLRFEDSEHRRRMINEVESIYQKPLVPRQDINQESMTYNNGHNAVAGKTYLIDTIETVSRGAQFDPNAGNKMHEIIAKKPELTAVEKVFGYLQVAKAVSGEVKDVIKSGREIYNDVFGKAAEDVKEKSKKRAKQGAGDAESLDF